jgi:hypothetical protein
MSPKSKQEVTEALKSRYRSSDKKGKKKILDEFCATCGYNRKYAIRVLNSKQMPQNPFLLSKRGRKKIYDDPYIFEILHRLWTCTNLPCSKRLVAILPIWLPHYPDDIPDKIYKALLKISASSIDRLMKPHRAKYKKRGLATTKPGYLLKKKIPVKTNQWDETQPGFVEADTVAHCGNSIAGMFAYTVNCVDIATTWTEQRAVWGKGELGVLQAIENIEHSLPFPLNGFDCDNGSEFLNWHLHRNLTQRKNPVNFTRSRPYRKNDNAHVEEKNWTHIRQYLGYYRFEKKELVALLNNLYLNEWRLYFNFFIPSVKLVAKHRDGARVVKKYDRPKTPFQRVLESEHIPVDTKKKLRRTFESINPFELQAAMSEKIKTISKIAMATAKTS